MAAATTTEFVSTRNAAEALPFSLIEHRGLLSRLSLELRSALTELIRDPRGFLNSLVRSGSVDAKRRQRLRIGVVCALITHLALLAVIAILGWRTVFVKVAPTTDDSLVWVPRPKSRPPTDTGDLPKGDKHAGGGGGGDHNPLPPTRGPIPQMAERPQIVKPNTPEIVLPKITLPPTIVGPDGSPPPPGIALGVPTGVVAEAPSPGPGGRGGLGGANGSGAGPGSGPGAGPGTGGGGPGGRNRIGVPTGRDDDIPTQIAYNRINQYPDRTGIVWLHRARPVVTPEAQSNKVLGEVLLRATFRADGTITDIEVVRQVAFMTESAIESLTHSTFRPATIKGRPVTVTGVLVRINVDVVEQ